MLDHDELLPEEQAAPDLLQELRVTYQMKPEEQRVLARVCERLAQNAEPLPLPLSQPESVQTGGSSQKQRHIPSTSSPPLRFNKPRQRWLRSLNGLVAVLFVGVLVGALAFTFATLNHSRVGSSPGRVTGTAMRIVLVPAQQGSKPSQAQMETTRTMLSRRLTNFGLQGFSVRVQRVNGQPGIVLEVPHFGGNEQLTIDTLVETGVLAFWDTGPYSQAAIGIPFHPELYSEYNPGDKPRFTNQDLDLSALAFNQDPATGIWALNCMMKGGAINRFQRYTADNIGHTLTVTLDGIVLDSATIHSAIAGPFALDTKATQQQGNAIVAVLKFGPLPVELKKLE